MDHLQPVRSADGFGIGAGMVLPLPHSSGGGMGGADPVAVHAPSRRGPDRARRRRGPTGAQQLSGSSLLMCAIFYGWGLGLFGHVPHHRLRSEEHTSELQSLMRISYAVFCLKK